MAARLADCRFTEKCASLIMEDTRLSSSLAPQPSHKPAASTLSRKASNSVSVSPRLLRKSRSLLSSLPASPCGQGNQPGRQLWLWTGNFLFGDWLFLRRQGDTKKELKDCFFQGGKCRFVTGLQ